MTFPTGPRRYADNRYSYTPQPEREPDPLTDSASHRLMIGTRVMLHLHGGVELEVGLTTIRDVTTWTDLVERIMRAMPIEVLASRRRVFGGGVVLWAEVTSDPTEEPS